MDTQSIKHMNRQEVKDYLFCIQEYFKKSIDNGTDIDDILDNTTILDEFEEYLSEEVADAPLFVNFGSMADRESLKNAWSCVAEAVQQMDIVHRAIFHVGEIDKRFFLADQEKAWQSQTTTDEQQKSHDHEIDHESDYGFDHEFEHDWQK